MARPLKTIRDVAEWQMCTGCGACANHRPEQIEMHDVPELGLRPIVREGPAGEKAAREALEVCAGSSLRHSRDDFPDGALADLAPGWGPILEIWEGYASDPAIRFAGSSGGAATALALACMEQAGMHGTLHIRARPSHPYLNETVLSTRRSELVEATGSRYAPASPCDSLAKIENAPAPCVFIGKPCDVAATSMARRLRPELDAKLGLTIGIFCAGTPSTQGTMALMKRMGVRSLDQVREVRYRGNGWPGLATIRTVDGEGGSETLTETYAESWALLQSHRQWRCYVCADHTGEFADIAVGDPWYREIPPGEPGRSLILIRSQRGKELFEKALATGYLEAAPVAPDVLPASQPELLKARGALVGRITTTRLFGAAAPVYVGFPMWRFFFSELTLKEQLQSFYGTLKRVFTKRLRRRRELVPRDARLDPDG